MIRPKRPTFGQAFFVDMLSFLSDVWLMATDKHGTKFTVRVDETSLPSITQLMKERGILKVSDFLRQAIANELRRAEDERDERTLQRAIQRQRLRAELEPRFDGVINDAPASKSEVFPKSQAPEARHAGSTPPVPKHSKAG